MALFELLSLINVYKHGEMEHPLFERSILGHEKDGKHVRRKLRICAKNEVLSKV